MKSIINNKKYDPIFHPVWFPMLAAVLNSVIMAAEEKAEQNSSSMGKGGRSMRQELQSIDISRTRSRLIRSMVYLCLALIFINLSFTVVSSRVSYLQHSQETTAMLARQIGSAYDLYFRQITELVNKTAVFDIPVYDLRDREKDPYDFFRGIRSELDALAAANTHIHSASLAIPEADLVVDSRMIGSHIMPLSSYYDRDLFSQASSSAIYVSNPRALYMSGNAVGPLVVSVLCPAAMKHSTSPALLCVNVAVEQIFQEAKKVISPGDSIRMAILSSEKETIIGSPELASEIASGEELSSRDIRWLLKDRTTAAWDLPTLKWLLVLDTRINPFFRMQPWMFILNLFLVLLVLVFVILRLIKHTAPIDTLEKIADQARWQRFLLSELALEDEKHLPFADQGLMTCILIPRSIDSLTDWKKTTSENGFHCQLIRMGAASTAAILWDPIQINELVFKEKIALIADQYCKNQGGRLYIGTPQSAHSLLPLSWQQCREMERCSLSLRKPCCFYESSYTDRIRDLLLPDHFQQKLHNLILSGESEKVREISQSIFKPILEDRTFIDNEHLVHQLTMILNSLMNSFLSIPLHMDEPLPAFTSDMSLEEISSSFISFLECIAARRADPARNLDEELYRKMTDYIQAHYASSALSLQQVCEELGIQNSTGSRIIRDFENLSFPEYVNRIRIERAKELLSGTNKTIEEISRDSGYNYAYYFIKVFKGLEGITPGQYRTHYNEQGRRQP